MKDSGKSKCLLIQWYSYVGNESTENFMDQGELRGPQPSLLLQVKIVFSELYNNNMYEKENYFKKSFSNSEWKLLLQTNYH